MPSHDWGDDWFEKHGNDLNHAIRYCTEFWRRWGRIGSHGKEKYGTFRDHPFFWDGGITNLFWPGYVYIQRGWHFINFKLDRYIIKPFTKHTRLLNIGRWWQRQVYNYAVQKMCKAHPDIIDEIVADLEAYRMVRPGIFGPIDGTVIHNKHWTKL